MLGQSIADPGGLEGLAGKTEGLGLLEVSTVMNADKTLREVTAVDAGSGLAVKGYEIHLGQTEGSDCQRPFGYVDQQPEGACSEDGRVQGSYLHGLFREDAFRQSFLTMLGAPASDLSYDKSLDDVLDRLADHLEEHLDVDALLALAR